MDPIIPVPRALRLWGVVGAAVAGLFAVWMFFFPSLLPTHFAWVVEPRLAQAFIGAGYVFRTAFFLQFVFARNWLHIRWTFWGNLAFTGTLLLATLWHADEMNWRFLVAHLWILFYTFEPITMIFSAPLDSQARTDHGRTNSTLVSPILDRRSWRPFPVRRDADHQPRVVGPALAVGSQRVRRAHHGGLVDGLDRLGRHDGDGARLGRATGTRCGWPALWASCLA